jgi:hypothetical protein
VNELPADWDSERFTLVRIRNQPAMIALHSRSHNRFMRLVRDRVDARGGPQDVDFFPNAWLYWKKVRHHMRLP